MQQDRPLLEKPRPLSGRISRHQSIYFVLLAILAGCDSKPVNLNPSRSEIVGIWECTDFPAGFLKAAETSPGSITSRIEFRDDGTCAAKSLPQRSRYRFIDIDNSTWEIVDPTMTPSGSWSIEFDGEFVQCRKDCDTLVLRYLISGKDEYTVDYKRTAARK